MKFQRHNAIRELVAHALVANQDELRRKLRRRGFEVTQATLSRDIHELQTYERAQTAIPFRMETETERAHTQLMMLHRRLRR